jgi:subfamily B ATP-binding cassette protein MsbA
MIESLRDMLSYLSRYRRQFAVGQIAMLFATAAGLAFPWAVRGVFDVLFENSGPQPLLIAVGILAAVSVLREVANLIKNRTLGLVGQKIIRDLRAQLYEKLLQLSLDYYSDRSSGEIASSMSNDMSLLQQGLSSGLSFVLQQTISLVAVLILLARIDPVLMAAVLATIPLTIVISQRIGRRVKSISNSTQERLGHLMAIMNESISGIDVIKAFVLENYAIGLFRDQNEQILLKSAQGIKASSFAGLLVGLLNALFLLVTIGFGGYRVAGGHLGPADLIAFILYAEMVTGPISTLAGIYIDVNRTVAAYQRIDTTLSARSRVYDASGVYRPNTVTGRVQIADVSFSYDGRSQVLDHLNLTIEPGQCIALVGPSGAGKSTLVKLIPRFYDPTMGAVLIDGTDIREMDLEYLRSQIAVVPQETHLFGLSVWENIACGRPDASEHEIVRAAEMANAHEFITQFEQGYDTQVGEGGARLSGGQRQRVAIARAFLKDPRILILDEATSALDTHAEMRVQDALNRLMRGRTTLTIAHRLSTVVNANKIIVLTEGRILAIGTHGSLLKSCPFYQDLYSKQFSTTRDELNPDTMAAEQQATGSTVAITAT